jgi:CheY-like chemotaxis protein
MVGDEVRIRQIMLNLLTNAVKFTDSGFISFSINSMEDYNGGFALRIEVADSGRGIKEEDLESLFEMFMQFDAKYNKDAEGTGLGLAITKNLVLAMNGEINVKSEFGVGSTFTIMIPQTACGKDKFAVIDNPQEKNVLVYERRSYCVESIEWTMKNLGIKYTIVETEMEFLDELKSNDYSHAFVDANLFKSINEALPEKDYSTKIALIVDFGESIFDHDLSVLYTPIYSLPVANVLNNTDTSSKESYIKRGGGKFTAPSAKVLIVDDINTNLFIAKGLMSPYQMQIDTVLSGKQALQMLKQNRYDIVFMDEKMPEMNGIEATAHIRELGKYNPFYKKLPVIALTANVMLSSEDVYLKHGFNDFLAKPIDTGKLNTILEKWIPRSKKSTLGSEKKATASKHAIEGLNTENGIKNSGGDYEFYMESLAVFYEDGILKLDEIKNSFENGNIHDYSIYVHAIKSAAANIGADRISEAATILEAAADRGDMDYIKAHTAGFLADLKELLDVINEQALK